MMVRSETRGLVKVMIVTGFITALALIAFAFNPVFALALPIVAVVAGALLACQVASYSLIQTIARPDMRGRIISLNVSFIMGGPALGALAIGWLADRIGLPAAEITAGIAALILLALISPAMMRRRDAIEAEPT
jgi:predicted MFS family arabinose efflux permease